MRPRYRVYVVDSRESKRRCETTKRNGSCPHESRVVLGEAFHVAISTCGQSLLLCITFSNVRSMYYVQSVPHRLYLPDFIAQRIPAAGRRHPPSLCVNILCLLSSPLAFMHSKEVQVPLPSLLMLAGSLPTMFWGNYLDFILRWESLDVARTGTLDSHASCQGGLQPFPLLRGCHTGVTSWLTQGEL